MFLGAAVGAIYISLGYFGGTFGITFVPVGYFLEPFSSPFNVNKQTRAPRVPQEAPPPKWSHPFGHLWDVIFHTFSYFQC